MEFVQNTKDLDFQPDWRLPAVDLARRALAYCEVHLKSQLTCYRVIKPEHVNLDIFWGEYIWCVYTSGFNASVVSKMYPRLWNAYSKAPPLGDMPWDAVGIMIAPINANCQKFKAIKATATHLKEIGWDEFRKRYLTHVDNIPRGCNYIGKITKYHLGRNIGLDCVKPDLHLNRVAKWYGWANPHEMCSYLSERLGERIGVVDFVLWAYCAAYGTREIDT
jgi:hypothetical protein